MMFDVITISDDDEEVQFDSYVRKGQPHVIDLTKTRRKKRRTSSDSSSSSECDANPTASASSSPAPASPHPSFQSDAPHQEPAYEEPATNQPQAQQQSQAQSTYKPQSPQSCGPKQKSPEIPKSNPPPQSNYQQHPQQEHPRQEQREQQELRQQQHQQQSTAQPTAHLSPARSRPTIRRPPPSDHDLLIVKKETGNKHFRCNSFNEAIRYYREAAELAKKLNNTEMSAIIHFNLAMSYDKLGAHNQAADECAAAVRLNDSYIKAHVKRAEIFMSQGKYEEAVICYEHVCDLDSTKRDDAMKRIHLAKELFKRAKKQDQHEILGLKPHFSLDDLRAAYKQKARAHHPDKHSDADVVTRQIHEKIFKDASEAYSFFRKRFA